MNDLLDNLNAIDGVKAIAYADDLTLVMSDNRHFKLDRKISKCLNMVEQWCASTGLSVSPEKTQWMDIGKRSAAPDVRVVNASSSWAS